jgi:hypothetical protein
MRKSSLTALLISVVALLVGACDSNNEPPQGAPSGYLGCRQYTSCASCTPVSGCGWCYLADGTGRCADDPNDCAGSPVFTWTWNPNGCYVTADASVVPADSGPPGDAAGDAAADASGAGDTATISADVGLGGQDDAPAPD